MNIDGFINYLTFERRASRDTIRAYKTDIAQFHDFLNTTYEIINLKEVKSIHIRSWMVDLLNNGNGVTTVKRKLSSLKSLFNYLQKFQNFNGNPMAKVPMPKSGKKLPVFLRENAVEKLLNKLNWADDFSGQRDRLILDLLYNTGLRRGELIRLSPFDIDWSANLLKISGKGGKERIVPFGNHLAESIQYYLKLREQQFPSLSTQTPLLLTDKGVQMYPKFVYNKVKAYLSIISTEEQLSPHVLRHTFATHLANNGADLNAIKELLGHASLAATQVYTHNTIEQLKKVYQQAHPKAKIDGA